MATAAKKGGRPRGARDPNAAERARRSLSKIYDAQIRAALNGSTDAARFCVDLAKGHLPDDKLKP